jgi:tryptophan-rich sensory protein
MDEIWIDLAWLKFQSSSLFCFDTLIVGFLGSIAASPRYQHWHASLVKPLWAPSNWVFAPIWTILFILMGLALYLAWRQGLGRRDVRFAVLIFGVQLVLNLLWSIVFFSFHAILSAFIVILWIAILANIIAFYVYIKTSWNSTCTLHSLGYLYLT